MSLPNDRYVNLTVGRRADGKEVYRSARPASVITNEGVDITLFANQADRIDVIANNVYGSSEDWWKIAAANKIVNGSLFIKPGTKLLIPKV